MSVSPRIQKLGTGHIFCPLCHVWWLHTRKMILLILPELANAWKGYICKINITQYRGNQSPDDLFTVLIDFSKPHFLVLLQLIMEMKQMNLSEVDQTTCCKCTSTPLLPTLRELLYTLLIGVVVWAMHAWMWDAISNKMEADKGTFWMELTSVTSQSRKMKLFLSDIWLFMSICD